MDFKNDPIAPKVQAIMNDLKTQGVKLDGGSQYNPVFNAIYKLIKEKESRTKIIASMMNNFTPEQIEAAQKTKALIIKGDFHHEKCVYMAGEICMHEELKPLLLQYKSAIEFAMKNKHLWDVENNIDTLYLEEDTEAIHQMEQNFERLLKL